MLSLTIVYGRERHEWSSISCDAILLQLLEEFQRNLSQIFIMWVGIVEKVLKVRGQRSRSQRDQMYCCSRDIHSDGVDVEAHSFNSEYSSSKTNVRLCGAWTALVVRLLETAGGDRLPADITGHWGVFNAATVPVIRQIRYVKSHWRCRGNDRCPRQVWLRGSSWLAYRQRAVSIVMSCGTFLIPVSTTFAMAETMCSHRHAVQLSGTDLESVASLGVRWRTAPGDII